MAKNGSAAVDTVEKPTAEICWGKFYDKNDDNCANKCGLSDSCKVALAKVEALLRPMKKELFPGSYEDDGLEDEAVNAEREELKLVEPEDEAQEPEDEAPSVVIDDDDDEEGGPIQVEAVAVDDDDEEDLGKPNDDGQEEEVVPVAVVDDDDEEELIASVAQPADEPTEEQIAAVVDGANDDDDEQIAPVLTMDNLPEPGDPEELAKEEEESVDTDNIWDNIDDDDDEDE